MERGNLNKQIILVDAAYLDEVAADMRRHFSRLLGREVPSADLSEWLVCAALDAGMEKSDEQIMTVFVANPEMNRLNNLTPSNLVKEIDGMAFQDNYLGEFSMSVVSKAPVATGTPLFLQCAEALLASNDVKVFALVPNMSQYGEELTGILGREENRKIVLMTMLPEAGKGFVHETLGYSLMHSLGIRGEELE